MTTADSMRKVVLITGITGQMGFYVAREFLNRGYRVVGTLRYTSNVDEDVSRVCDMINRHCRDSRLFNWRILELDSQSSISESVREIKPDIFVNCAAMAHVGESWKIPETAADITGVAVLRCLEAIRQYNPECSFVQCSSSEMFGGQSEGTINEESKLMARSPYGAAKIFGHQIVNVYRQSYNIPAYSMIFFNYESVLRSLAYLPRKITSSMGEILEGKKDKIVLGNLNFCRDWGYAGDYAHAIRLAVEHNWPTDYVVSTGVKTTGYDFIRKAFSYANFCLEYDFFDFDKHIVCDSPDFVRPNDLVYLCGDSSKIRGELKWKPEVTIDQLITKMVNNDVFNKEDI